MLKLIPFLKKKCRNYKLHFYYSKFLFYCSKDILKTIIGRMKIIRQNGSKKRKPKAIQFPLLNNCNLRCKTCSVYNYTYSRPSLIDLQKVVKDDFFSKVLSVGINGGEPFILPNIQEYVNVLLSLPKIKNISIISNGILTTKILEKLEIMYEMCKGKNVKLNFTVSLDGYKDIHDKIRGKEGAFDRTIKTYSEVNKNKNKYCDNLGIICTISRHNIYYIKDFLAYVDLNKLDNVSYQLAVNHQRLHTEDLKDFSVLDDKYSKMLTQEFFYELFTVTKEKKYYFIFRYLNDEENRIRMSPCGYAEGDITIDGLGNLLYCATASKIIGQMSWGNLSKIFFAKKNIDYRKDLVKNECDSCIHYTTNKGYLKSNIQAYKELRNKSTWYYKLS